MDAKKIIADIEISPHQQCNCIRTPNACNNACTIICCIRATLIGMIWTGILYKTIYVDIILNRIPEVLREYFF